MSACCSKKTVRLGKQKGIQDILVFFRKEDTRMRQYEYTFTAMERAMEVQEVILRAIDGRHFQPKSPNKLITYIPTPYGYWVSDNFTVASLRANLS